LNVFEAISTRRSIRKYTGELIIPEKLETVLKAGFQAPSAHNIQPREYIVINDPETLAEIAKVHTYAKMLPQAGQGIIVCGDKEKQPLAGFLIADCAAAIQNMLLAAHGLGLGAVWCGLYPVTQLTKAIAKICCLPDNIIPVGLVVLGQKTEEKNPADRFDQTKIHQEKWQGGLL